MPNHEYSDCSASNCRFVFFFHLLFQAQEPLAAQQLEVGLAGSLAEHHRLLLGVVHRQGLFQLRPRKDGAHSSQQLHKRAVVLAAVPSCNPWEQAVY